MHQQSDQCDWLSAPPMGIDDVDLVHRSEISDQFLILILFTIGRRRTQVHSADEQYFLAHAFFGSGLLRLIAQTDNRNGVTKVRMAEWNDDANAKI